MNTGVKSSVSIIVKAFNEEQHIGPAIESALAALDDLDGEVILADGASTDRTIEIARNYPIRIVRLSNPAQRSCGAGTQLGFQYSTGRYVCHMDGDMQLHPGFLGAAIRYLEDNPAVAGVGGTNIERQVSNLEFAKRAKKAEFECAPGAATRLHGMGVYRRSAIEAIGYLTDRNLHGGEELDLAARLHARGWTLAKINQPAVEHYGHAGNAYLLLLRRVLTRNSYGCGELVRAAVGRPHFGFLVRHDRTLMLCGLVPAWWASIAAILWAFSGTPAVFAGGALAALPLAAMSLRWRSLQQGLYSVVAWHVYAVSFWPGLLRARISPISWIESTLVMDAVATRYKAHLRPQSTPAAQMSTPSARQSQAETSGQSTRGRKQCRSQ